LNFTTAQRTALLTSSSTLALLYTPSNEHFGIVPIEAMLCGVPVLACNNGGPTESIIDSPPSERTGWLREPKVELWRTALEEIVSLGDGERKRLAERAKKRAREVFGMDTMSAALEASLRDAVSLGKPKLKIGGLSVVALLSLVIMVLAVWSVRLLSSGL
jgi:alpha-1,3/alpha-1,6-mannosyltransferase